MFLDIFIGYEVKIEIWAIKGVVRGLVIFGVIFGENKTLYCESYVL